MDIPKDIKKRKLHDEDLGIMVNLYGSGEVLAVKLSTLASERPKISLITLIVFNKFCTIKKEFSKHSFCFKT